ncbi:response regulator transcription factor [Curtobacterium sp. 22159]|uniref:helix-turn-helix transcriptional regulator n=1 Tax=Curtobacterium sp. 22159 TaxID=3453882 RepID=UPI003F8481DE
MELPDAVRRAGLEQGWEAAAALIGRHWDAYATTAPEQVLDAIGVLPGSVLLNDATLVVAANYLQHVVSGEDPTSFDPNRALSTGEGPVSGTLTQQLTVRTGISANARVRGDVREALEAAEEGRHLLEQARGAAADPTTAAELDRVQPNLPHFFIQWGRTREAAEARGAVYEFEQAHHLGLRTRQPQVARVAAGHLAWHHIERGRVHVAAQWLETALGVGDPDPRYEGIVHLAAALIALERGDRQAAGVALARMRAYPTGEYWAPALWVRALHVVTREEATLVQNEFAHELDRHPRNARGPVDARYLRTVRLTLGIRPGDDGPRSTTTADLLLDAVDAFSRGDFERASELVREPAAATDHAIPRVRANALLLAAAVSRALDRPALAVELFERGHAILEREQLTTPYRTLPQEMVPFFAEATGRPIAVERGVEPTPVPMALGTLTPRERELLALLGTKAKFADIGAQLYLSPNSVKTAAQRLYRKLGVNSRGEAAEIALRAGLARG